MSSRSFLITWNPKKFAWKELPNNLDELATAGSFTMSWSVGNRTDLPVASRLYLMRLGEEPKGLVGSGWTTTLPATGSHWDEERAAFGDTIRCVTVEFDALSEHPILPLNELLDYRFAGIKSWTPQAGGVELSPEVAAALEVVWQQRLTLGPGLDSSSPPRSQSTYPEGALRSIRVNAYERKSAARRDCIAHHGTSCAVCAFSFEATYGPEFRGLIHVHHIRPLSGLGPGYEVDPIADLVPLCPNCHAAIHWKQVTSTVEELRERVVAASHRKPSTRQSGNQANSSR